MKGCCKNISLLAGVEGHLPNFGSCMKCMFCGSYTSEFDAATMFLLISTWLFCGSAHACENVFFDVR